MWYTYSNISPQIKSVCALHIVEQLGLTALLVSGSILLVVYLVIVFYFAEREQIKSTSSSGPNLSTYNKKTWVKCPKITTLGIVAV